MKVLQTVLYRRIEDYVLCQFGLNPNEPVFVTILNPISTDFGEIQATKCVATYDSTQGGWVFVANVHTENTVEQVNFLIVSDTSLNPVSYVIKFRGETTVIVGKSLIGYFGANNEVLVSAIPSDLNSIQITENATTENSFRELNPSSDIPNMLTRKTDKSKATYYFPIMGLLGQMLSGIRGNYDSAVIPNQFYNYVWLSMNVSISNSNLTNTFLLYKQNGIISSSKQLSFPLNGSKVRKNGEWKTIKATDKIFLNNQWETIGD